MESYERSQAIIETALLWDDITATYQHNAYSVGICQSDNLAVPANLVLTGEPGELYSLQLWQATVQ